MILLFLECGLITLSITQIVTSLEETTTAEEICPYLKTVPSLSRSGGRRKRK
jgi:hypothetical protein